MPELPEVEVVRRGLERWVVGRTIASVGVTHPRAVRRHAAGPDDFAAVLSGARIEAARRRGKYLWLPLTAPGAAAPDDALLAHLGMSGQLLVKKPDAPRAKHLHVRFTFTDGGDELWFVDQRTFGGVSVEHGGAVLPPSIAHIARDVLDPLFDGKAFHAALRRRDSELKRALLDQSLVSGIGNIYADEALWRARLHGARSTATMTRPQTARLLDAVREVMTDALAAGGTSFDSLYVNVNGSSGYFARSLNAYGREGDPCDRCATPIRRITFMNRSSYFCTKCQPIPRPRSTTRRESPTTTP
ncbi:bifunctional DNA-formamidopyrimidine glycosylase/DNA-(apurinic or apyrimidinic site) lyase [Yinghuangia sp. ASG 101]|uniref:bifunctional DNA-formamidopyrimidine glycosylase/DNA-(apurinic or apyrimidinic site) lyase n=1 Tax=Yinghuangia sp. ASG 101 TaxID=2896848 RepID=UPI001E46B803|nr:bifunctional DNA-formamidopyrimidine glycosylase/DNA-(apurinic or apyrimidinic site) lyase [Yinghuangia sp. ASG 101]UGQ14135.1 bifunctional DNA-formamidopyrimidine glycosylase/DNA-(apurinic or apyrimidinic site) lyase [Yinghuangia sp. ASG 101]